ncbi:MAG: hypothetical protein II359_07840 [Clostridia bacterium]|nr:hypothetical protein [Clostridia bacterium]
MRIGDQIIFTGNGSYAIDPKGRVSIPADYRRDMGEESCMITCGSRKCLRIYPMVSYRNVVLRLMEISDNFNGDIMLDPHFRRIVETFTSEAVEGKIDDHGRMLIPLALRERIGVDKQTYIRGCGNVFEIWAEEEWKENALTKPEDFEASAHHVAKLFKERKEGAFHE